MRRFAGYALTGSIEEHAVLFIHGPGGNGKSVFLNTLSGILGDYAVTAPPNMMMATYGDRHPTELAGLRGARLVAASETEHGSRWAEAKLKAISGGDPITARFMRGDFFTFEPTFKLVLVGNHRPSIAHVDEAMQRRLNLVPFEKVVPSEQRDHRLPEKLRAEAPGILAWMIAGCLEWQRGGLRPPPVVVDASQEYFAAEDLIGRFIEECCDTTASAEVSSTSLYRAWQSWCEQQGEAAGSQKSLSSALKMRGFTIKQRSTGRHIAGLGLRGSVL